MLSQMFPAFLPKMMAMSHLRSHQEAKTVRFQILMDPDAATLIRRAMCGFPQGLVRMHMEVHIGMSSHPGVDIEMCIQEVVCDEEYPDYR